LGSFRIASFFSRRRLQAFINQKIEHCCYVFVNELEQLREHVRDSRTGPDRCRVNRRKKKAVTPPAKIDPKIVDPFFPT